MLVVVNDGDTEEVAALAVYRRFDGYGVELDLFAEVFFQVLNVEGFYFIRQFVGKRHDFPPMA